MGSRDWRRPRSHHRPVRREGPASCGPPGSRGRCPHRYRPRSGRGTHPSPLEPHDGVCPAQRRPHRGLHVDDDHCADRGERTRCFQRSRIGVVRERRVLRGGDPGKRVDERPLARRTGERPDLRLFGFSHHDLVPAGAKAPQPGGDPTPSHGAVSLPRGGNPRLPVRRCCRLHRNRRTPGPYGVQQLPEGLLFRHLRSDFGVDLDFPRPVDHADAG